MVLPRHASLYCLSVTQAASPSVAAISARSESSTGRLHDADSLLEHATTMSGPTGLIPRSAGQGLERDANLSILRGRAEVPGLFGQPRCGARWPHTDC